VFARVRFTNSEIVAASSERSVVREMRVRGSVKKYVLITGLVVAFVFLVYLLSVLLSALPSTMNGMSLFTILFVLSVAHQISCEIRRRDCSLEDARADNARNASQATALQRTTQSSAEV
jgi:uncharacterized membrane protein